MTVLSYPPLPDFGQGPSWDPQIVRARGGEGPRWLDSPRVMGAWVFPEVWLLSSASWPLPQLAWVPS